jgi:FkbM family methyltransferase
LPYALLEKKTYAALGNVLANFANPVDLLARYVFLSGNYPRRITVRTPIGNRDLTVYSPHDVRTVMVCFAKEDYRVDRRISCFVDFGSNIGISGAYFLSRNSAVRGYLFEPLATNVERLKTNLAGLEDRYVLQQCAIGIRNETVEFAYEPAGRYGGIGLNWPSKIPVEARSANDVLREIIAKEGFVDMVKINIEGLEHDVIRSLSPDVLQKIGVIAAETFGYEDDLPGFSKARHGVNITRFERRFPPDGPAPRPGYQAS